MYRVAGLARVAAHLSVAVWKLNVLAPRWSEARRRTEIERWSRKVFTILRSDLQVTGTPVEGDRRVLYVANHVSWLDIYAMFAASDMCFVAKSDIRKWPVIGALATDLGTVFIDRDKRAGTRTANVAIFDRLANQQPVCVFPEGTTTDGTTLAPFRPALFDAAIARATWIQPVAIRYVAADGSRQDEASFTGDTSLMQSLWALFGTRAMRAELTFLPAFAAHGLTRRDAAHKAQAAIANHLGVAIRVRSQELAPRAMQGVESFDLVTQ